MALALLCVKKKERYSVFKFYNPIENYELGKQLHLIWCWYSSVPTNVSTSYLYEEVDILANAKCSWSSVSSFSYQEQLKSSDWLQWLRCKLVGWRFKSGKSSEEINNQLLGSICPYEPLCTVCFVLCCFSLFVTDSKTAVVLLYIGQCYPCHKGNPKVP